MQQESDTSSRDIYGVSTRVASDLCWKVASPVSESQAQCNVIAWINAQTGR